ncbi:pectate lyase [Candidatus Sumerlaeota bacterium]|nr:pectate lyase [Candidatus Sumerlaeota bacterium]
MTTFPQRTRRGKIMLCAFVFMVAVQCFPAEETDIRWKSGAGNCLNRSAEFYGSETALRIANNVLLHQCNNGGWPKNYDRARILSPDEKEKILSQKKRNDTTFDNGSTHSEVRYLAKVYNATSDERYQEAFLRGVEFILQAQYGNGGWPQYYPDARKYAKYITFNDGAMIGVMIALREIAQDKASYPFVDAQLRSRCANAVDKGVQCILKCQIEVNGKKTAWCAQHDDESLEPRDARSYELASISGSESVGIVRFLMEIDNPSPEIIDAIQCAIAWFDGAQLNGIRVTYQKVVVEPETWDKVVIQDDSAPPLWARFYDIGTNKPIFCGRDGKRKATLAEIDYERRNGYSWLGSYAQDLLAKEYPAWQKKWAPDDDVLRRENR